jgi:uncharacterized membrane protein (DUF485 family)
MTTRDVGNGLVVLGLILLALYLTFVLLPPSLYSEYTNPVWTEARVAPGVLLFLVALVVAGLALRKVSPRLPSEVESELGEEE